MRPKAPLLVLGLILALALAAAVLVLVESRHGGAARARGKEYQELIGGLGFGPDVDLSRCATSFDPRLCRRCPHDFGPVPAGGCFCPHHASSIFWYPAFGSMP